MGLFNDIGRGALGWSTGGLSELGRRHPFGLGGDTDSTAPAPWNPITAQNTAIPASLAATMGGIGTAAYNKIGANYAGAKSKLASDAQARGMNGAVATAPGSYAGQRLATTQGLDTGNLESALGGQMGSTAYQDTLANRDYGQNLTLADQIAALNRPNTLQQIFQGIGAVGKPVATYAGMAGRGGGGGGTIPNASGGGSAWNINRPGPLDLGYGGY